MSHILSAPKNVDLLHTADTWNWHKSGWAFFILVFVISQIPGGLLGRGFLG